MNARIYVDVPPNLKERLREHAYQRSKTQGQVVTAALEEYLDRHGERVKGPGVRKSKGGAK